MATAKKTTTKTAGPATKGIQVSSRPESFWRGGLQFTREARTVPLAELTEEQLELIRAEGEPGGMLVVEDVDIEAAKA